MAVKPFSKEELNFFKFASIVHDEFPKMLRSTFVALWDSKFAPLPGDQVWDDSPSVRKLLKTSEGGKTVIPTSKSIEDWDCTALFQATIYSKTFAISTTTTIKTLSDQFIKRKKPSPFHASLISPTGTQDETITLAIDQIRLLRNELCHSPKPVITKPTFDNYVQLALDAFIAVGFPTDQIFYIGSLEEVDFPTERVNELNRKNRDVELENFKFLKENVEERITTLTDNNKRFKANVMQKLDRINENFDVIKNQASKTETKVQVKSPTDSVLVESNENLRISSREILKSIKHWEKFQILKDMDVGKLKKIGPQLQYFATQKNLLLGRGSHGTSVYVGILQDGSEVAVKKVLLEAADENEVAVLRRIDTTKSPYILSYRDFLEDENFMYLILDLCEETLKEYVESHNILHLREEGPRMIKEILLGVKFLHDLGILHRDLKPSNILVDLKGQMKLADFGLSRVLNEDETTVKTFGKGTQGWMAAEVIEARNEERMGRYKKKSDIQSIGMISFFILTGGRHPFGVTLRDRMTNISNGNPVDLDALDDYGDAKRFVAWLISHDIDSRPYAYEALEHPFLLELREVTKSVKHQEKFQILRNMDVRKLKKNFIQMNSSKEHHNWLTVGEIIRLIKEPVALYTSNIIEKWHAKLCGSLPGKCSNPGDCEKKKKPPDLCPSCKQWYDELAKSHQKNDNGQFKSMWRQNCDTSEWPNDPWEVAKFFMPSLGDNKKNVEDAEFTDLSSLLNVLGRTEDVVFAPGTRVDLNLVGDLRSKVRNTWAHAPNQNLDESTLNDAFGIADKFLAHLDMVFSREEVKNCIEDIKALRDTRQTKVTENELKNLNLRELRGDDSQKKGEMESLKEELKSLNDTENPNLQVIKEQEEKIKKLEKDYRSLQDLMKSLQDSDNVQATNQPCQLKSCIPDKPEMFIGRDNVVKELISSLVESGCGIVCIVGGPGFGKSTVAKEVSHNLSENHEIIVFFSYLQNISTVSDVTRCLCHDVGVTPGEDPESSLMLWLKGIESKVVLVMDSIEQLLESGDKSQFIELVLTLRKNSQQRVQMLATTRTEFLIPGQQSVNHRIKELDEKSSVQLLKECCPNDGIEDTYFSELAGLCGFLPLALCLAGKRIQDLDDPMKLTKWLRKKPMKTLKPVQQAFEFSFQMLNSEDKKALVCLSVFDGNFRMKSAKKIIGRISLETIDFLKDLVRRSLIQNTNDKRYVIHSLIRRFLSDNVQFHDEKAEAQGFMVSHFLKMCHSLTLKCYSYNGFTGARELFKKDIHNVKETLEICSQDWASNQNPNITKSLANSEIYLSSCTFFYSFSRDLLPSRIFKNFFESCIEFAKSRNQPVIMVIFQFLMADQVARRSSWESPEYTTRIESVTEPFFKNKALLKEYRSQYMFCYHLLARYYIKRPDSQPSGLTEDDLPPLPENRVQSSIEKSTEAEILMKRGNLNKKRADKTPRKDHKTKNKYRSFAEFCYNQALSLAKKVLGDHQLTCTLHKLIGDLCFKNDRAVTHYTDAINLHRKLKFDSNEKFVILLKNLGASLAYNGRYEKSVETLKEALIIAEKLVERNTPCRAQVCCELARTYRDLEPDCQEAEIHAKEAMKMQEFLHLEERERLENIIKSAEEYTVMLKIIEPFKDKVDVHVRTRIESCIPRKPQTFLGRDAEVNRINTSLMKNNCGIVSIVGEPSLGKSTVAIEVSHHISHSTVVIYSFLSNTSTVSEVIVRLCHDVGIVPGEDPESSLLSWLKSIEKKVVLVMDNVEQLLWNDVKPRFIELLLTLRKNSREYLQILTTSRTEFQIPGQTVVNHQLQVMDVKSSIELLRKCCPDEKIEDIRLSELANLCGFVPLALCIAGTLIPNLDDPSELVQWLRENPMEASSNSEQCVQKVIEFSFQKLSDDDKKALVCLSVFDGIFETDHAKEVIEKSSKLETLEFLKNLVCRGLIQGIDDTNFVIHPFVRRFLADHDHFQFEKAIAQGLMVKHFLTMCHSLTMDYYSHNGFTKPRESLKRNIHNVEKTLKIFTQDRTTMLKPNILEILTSSEIYKSSSSFFYYFSLDFVSPTVLRNFFESCIKLAESRQQPVIEITFHCLLAEQEGRKSAWKSAEYIEREKRIKAAFQENKDVLKDEKSLDMFCNYFLADSDMGRTINARCSDLLKDHPLHSPDSKEPSNIEKVAKAHMLINLGKLKKSRAKKAFDHKDKERYNEHMNCAELYYSKALSLARELLGQHKLTCNLYTLLGDLYSNWYKNEEALTYYTNAISLRKELNLVSDEMFVFLVKNCGACLASLRRFDESIKMLLEARDLANKLSEKHRSCRTSVYWQLANTCRQSQPSRFTKQ